jgi:hypothetical protein
MTLRETGPAVARVGVVAFSISSGRRSANSFGDGGAAALL